MRRTFALVFFACAECMAECLAGCLAGCGGARNTAPLALPTARTELPEVLSEEDAAIPIRSDDAVWGARDAPVTIVQFSDFECAACAELEIMLDELKQKYGAANLRVVFKHLPDAFHPNARDAAEASQGVLALAGNESFWAFHERAFTTENDLEQARYEEWAAASGVDAFAFREGMGAHAWAAKIKADEALATRLGVQKPPALFVNGAEVPDTWLLARFVEVERAKADEKLAGGVPASRIYRVMCSLNRTGTQ